jgi:hypothetical protein
MLLQLVDPAFSALTGSTFVFYPIAPTLSFYAIVKLHDDLLP